MGVGQTTQTHLLLTGLHTTQRKGPRFLPLDEDSQGNIEAAIHLTAQKEQRECRNKHSLLSKKAGP